MFTRFGAAAAVAAGVAVVVAAAHVTGPANARDTSVTAPPPPTVSVAAGPVVRLPVSAPTGGRPSAGPVSSTGHTAPAVAGVRRFVASPRPVPGPTGAAAVTRTASTAGPAASAAPPLTVALSVPAATSVPTARATAASTAAATTPPSTTAAPPPPAAVSLAPPQVFVGNPAGTLYSADSGCVLGSPDPLTGVTPVLGCRPMVTWVSTVAGLASDFAADATFRVVIYSQADTLAAGFAVGVTPAAADSGVLNTGRFGDGAWPMFPVTYILLLPGAWVAFVRVQNTAGVFSVWTAAPFVVAATVP